MVPQPQKQRSYALLGMLIGVVLGFIIGLVIKRIEISVFFLGILGALTGSFYRMK